MFPSEEENISQSCIVCQFESSRPARLAATTYSNHLLSFQEFSTLTFLSSKPGCCQLSRKTLETWPNLDWRNNTYIMSKKPMLKLLRSTQNNSNLRFSMKVEYKMFKSNSKPVVMHLCLKLNSAF